MNIEHYTYRVTWSPEDNEHVGVLSTNRRKFRPAMGVKP